MSDKNTPPKNNPLCPQCDGRAIKYGSRNNKQRYRCKSCKHTFYEPDTMDYKYTRNTKRILSLLFNILENDFFNANDLETALHPTEKYYKLARKVQFNTKCIEEQSNKKDIRISCYNAKLLICQDDKNITFIQIPAYNRQNSPENERKITIYDQKMNAEYNKKWNNPLVKTKNKK